MTDAEIRDQLFSSLGVARGTGHLKPQPRATNKGIEELLAGEVVSTPHGPFFLHRETYSLDHRQGMCALAELPARWSEAPAWLARDPRLARVTPDGLAFIDIETTGIAGGTGTYVFLVGVGMFERDSFTIYQYLMRDFNEELPLLAGLSALLDGVRAVVSFNGKSFDLPVLQTRFTMKQQAPPLAGAPHLDLLGPARRIWKHRLPSCALSSLEAEVLGIRRSAADVRGTDIPDIYLDYVRWGAVEPMVGVFYHNAQDVLSLVTLAARLCALVGDPALLLDALPGEDLYGLGAMLLERGDAGRAEPLLTQAARRSRSRAVRELAMRELAGLLKRQERRAEALPWWQELAACSQGRCDAGGAVAACEELAKHYEWHGADLAQALAWTERAAVLAGAWPPSLEKSETLAALRHRQARLAAKLDRR